MDSRDNILSINDLHVSYPHHRDTLRGVTFSIKRGSIVSVVGSNGAGKTTLLNTISGIIRYDGGKITGGEINFKGKRIDNLKPVQIIREGIVHILEGRREFSSLTIEENLCLGSLTRSGSPTKRGIEMVYSYFPSLFPKKKTLAADCGPGELQMLAIGRALMAQPELILLDEPYQRISPVLAGDLFSAISQINKEEAIAFIFVERAPCMSFQVTDDVLGISDGMIFRPDKGMINSSGLSARS
ncbi:MAG: ATP-binding cassette domain-containing protein [Deltaproteobacteria bacterium]|nr:ATP-binding cassette domain-containing protein [Deltaproteobacteria bacterium]